MKNNLKKCRKKRRICLYLCYISRDGEIEKRTVIFYAVQFLKKVGDNAGRMTGDKTIPRCNANNMISNTT